MPKITFIGAGSAGFTHRLLGDILSFESLRDSELAFMDTDKARLKDVELLASKYLASLGLKKKPLFTTVRKRALARADFVINLVKIGYNELAYLDLDLPKKYGLKQTIGDTCCVAGVFRGLRTMAFMADLAKDVEEVAARNCMILNYTNPQAMLVMTMAKISRVPFVGLCHSVQGTTRAIANYLGVPHEELVYQAAGINHMSWVTKLERKGKDLYPRLRKLVKQRGIYNTPLKDDDPVQPFLGPARLDMLNRTGYVVTESSTHFPEYVPFYARTDEQIEQYRIPIDQHKANMDMKAKRHRELMKRVRKGDLPPIKLSREYGSRIMDAVLTNQPCRIYGNVMNTGLITNLPQDAAVEVACLVDANGVQPCHYGALPQQLAMLCQMDISVYQLAVEGFLNRDIRGVYWALMADPLTHSKLTLDEIEAVVNGLVKRQQKYLGKYFRVK